MIFTDHALRRMAERQITESDVNLALNRPEGQPQPGSGVGNIVVTGIATGGRRLKVVCSAVGDRIISAYWV
jgi:hypothetical protein